MTAVYLTYENFRRLDVIARLQVGAPLCVLQHDQHPERNGVEIKEKVFKVPENGGMVEKIMYLPAIANSVDYEKWCKPWRLWLDQSRIPPELLFDFILHHEIAHIRHGDFLLLDHLIERGLFSRDDFEKVAGRAKAFYHLVEYRADRYAWDKIMPGVEMPIAGGEHQKEAEKEIRVLKQLCQAYYEDFERVKLRNITPISLDPELYIPQMHAVNGLDLFKVETETERQPDPQGGVLAVEKAIDKKTKLRGGKVQRPKLTFKSLSTAIKAIPNSRTGIAGKALFLVGTLVNTYGLLYGKLIPTVIAGVMVLIGTRCIKKALIIDRMAALGLGGHATKETGNA